MIPQLLYGLFVLVLLVTVSGCEAVSTAMKYLPAQPLAKFIEPTTVGEPMVAGDWYEQEWDACAGDTWEISLRWEVSREEEYIGNTLEVWFVLPAENISYVGQLYAKTSAGFVIPVKQQGHFKLRTQSPYNDAVIWLNVTRGRALELGCEPGPPEKVSEPAELDPLSLPPEIPAATYNEFQRMLNGQTQIYYRAELSWAEPVDLDLSSRWLQNPNIPLLNWRYPEYGGSGLIADVNNQCLAAISDPVEVFHWYLPLNEVCDHLSHVRFYVNYYSRCGTNLPEVEYTITIYGPNDKKLGSDTGTIAHGNQQVYYSLSELLDVPLCGPSPDRDPLIHEQEPRHEDDDD